MKINIDYQEAKALSVKNLKANRKVLFEKTLEQRILAAAFLGKFKTSVSKELMKRSGVKQVDVVKTLRDKNFNVKVNQSEVEISWDESPSTLV